MNMTGYGFWNMVWILILLIAALVLTYALGYTVGSLRTERRIKLKPEPAKNEINHVVFIDVKELDEE